jgi:hypothetical protein
MNRSNKKILTVNVGDEVYFENSYYSENPCDIDDVISFFSTAKKLGATHVYWKGDADVDGDFVSCSAQPYFTRKETDMEMETRLGVEKAAREFKINKERVLYEELKKKFES